MNLPCVLQSDLLDCVELFVRLEGKLRLNVYMASLLGLHFALYSSDLDGLE